MKEQRKQKAVMWHSGRYLKANFGSKRKSKRKLKRYATSNNNTAPITSKRSVVYKWAGCCCVMAQQRTFEIQIADGVIVTLTTCVPGTLYISFPDNTRDSFEATNVLEPVETPADYTIPITIDTPFTPKDLDYDPQQPPHACGIIPEIPQPTRQQLKTMLQENNITPLDNAHRYDNPPPPELFDPYEALVDYEDCMRVWCKTSVDEDAEFIEEPMVSGDQITDLSVDEILTLLPDTPLGLPWGITPFSSVNYPLLVHHAQQMTSQHIRKMLKTHPYIGGPRNFSPKGRDYPIPGKFLHRLLALGWITDEEAKSRWLDIDWFSLRDYRAYLAKKANVGNGNGEFLIVNKKRKEVFDGTMESRERIWKEKKNGVEYKRLDMELKVLMSEGRDQDAAVAFYEKCGAAYVTQVPPNDSDDTGGDVVPMEKCLTAVEVRPNTLPIAQTPSPLPSCSQPHFTSLHDSTDTLPRAQSPDADLIPSRSYNPVTSTVIDGADLASGFDYDTDEGDTGDLEVMQVQMTLSQFDNHPGLAVGSQVLLDALINSPSHKRKVSDLEDDQSDAAQKRRKMTSSSSPPYTSPHPAISLNKRLRAPLPRTPTAPLLQPIPLPDVARLSTPTITSAGQSAAEFTARSPTSSPMVSELPSTPREPGIRRELDVAEEDVVSPAPLRRSARIGTCSRLSSLGTKVKMEILRSPLRHPKRSSRFVKTKTGRMEKAAKNGRA
ncbi:hypothetical protein E1B28_013213, partial [Marasmius oreades]